jgi:C1A family cysteine protease
MKTGLLVVVLLIILTVPMPMQATANGNLTLADVQDAIKMRNAEWTAGDNSVWALTPQEKLGLVGPVAATTSDYPTQQSVVGLPPSHFDWRNVNGKDYTSPIKDQGSCGSCSTFGSAAVVESLLTMNTGSWMLSEQFALSCCGCVSCLAGGDPKEVFEFIRTTGLPDEGCLPYRADDTVPCGTACANWQNRVTKIDGWGEIGQLTTEQIKAHVLTYGPLGAEMAVYDDFYAYTGGIYEHVTGALSGYHWVAIVGFDDSGEYWIVKNSWGTGWGEDGWFRIRYGDSGIDSMLVIYAWMVGSNPESLSGASVTVIGGLPGITRILYEE